jgi:hypothetical protein
MFKQVCFFRKRPDMTMEEFIDYYENQHSQLSKRLGRSPSIPNAVRYVRRYLTPEMNPVTGEVIDPGFHCIMEIWWNSREDFENSQRLIGDPNRLPAIKEDEAKHIAIPCARSSNTIRRWAQTVKCLVSNCITGTERLTPGRHLPVRRGSSSPTVSCGWSTPDSSHRAGRHRP